MKKRMLFSLSVLVILALTFITASPVAAAERSRCNITEAPASVLDPGKWTTLPNGHILVRGMVEQYPEASSDPHCSGSNTIVFNASWSADYTGPIWGTYHFVTNEGGVWDGFWAGNLTSKGPWYIALGNGSGKYAGMHLWTFNNYGTVRAEYR